jgi:hypothetical protein
LSFSFSQATCVVPIMGGFNWYVDHSLPFHRPHFLIFLTFTLLLKRKRKRIM